MDGLELETPAQQRLVDELLGWGRERPRVDAGQLDQLRAWLESQLASLGDELVEVASGLRQGRVLITKTRLDRLACDGYALDAAPFTFSRASMRGILGHAVIERDWVQQRARAPAEVVEQVWNDEASRRSGDPSSHSAWMNAQATSEVATLKEDLAELLVGFREVWPDLSKAPIDVALEPAHEALLAEGRVVLYGRPDFVFSSRRADGLARTLVVDLKTGRPRPEHDRHELRFYALLVALSNGEVPFRWATYYVTEGRYDAEDLRFATLEATARRVVDGVRQQLRLARHHPSDPDGLIIRGGSWCSWCLRAQDCDVAARTRRAMSQGDGMIDA